VSTPTFFLFPSHDLYFFLNICWYTCWFIVCLFMLHSYRSVRAVLWRLDLQVYARQLARSQFHELPFPLRRISTTSSMDPFDA
jgi:hypothetical protein